MLEFEEHTSKLREENSFSRRTSREWICAGSNSAPLGKTGYTENDDDDPRMQTTAKIRFSQFLWQPDTEGGERSEENGGRSYDGSKRADEQMRENSKNK